MKTAIILCGYTRTWEKTIDSFKHTFDSMNADVFVTTYNKRYGYHPHIKSKTNFFTDELVTEDELVKAFEPINPKWLEIEDADTLEKALEEENKNLHYKMRGFNNSLGQFRKLKLAVDYLQEYETNNNIKYDYIIKTRCDMIYYPETDFNINPSEALVDSSNVYPNDCIIKCERDDFVHIANYLYEEFYMFRDPRSDVAPPHGMLEAAFKSRNLNIITRKLMKSVLRATGEDFY